MKKVIITILLTQVVFGCNNLTPKKQELQNNINKILNLEKLETVQLQLFLI
jgi:hypothetical protein